MSSFVYSSVLLGVAAIISRGFCITCYYCDLEVDPYCFNPAVTECDGASCGRVIEIDETLGIQSTVYNCFKEDECCDNLQKQMNEETKWSKKHLIDCKQCDTDMCNDPIHDVTCIQQNSENIFLVTSIDGKLVVNETASNSISTSEEEHFPEEIDSEGEIEEIEIEEIPGSMDIFLWQHPEEGLKGNVAYEPERKAITSNSMTNTRPLNIFQWNNPNKLNIAEQN